MFLAKTGEKTAPAIRVKDGADIELTRADGEPLIGTGAQRAGTAQADAVGNAAGLLAALETLNAGGWRDGNAVVSELGPALCKATCAVGHISLRLQPRDTAEHGRCWHNFSWHSG